MTNPGGSRSTTPPNLFTFVTPASPADQLLYLSSSPPTAFAPEFSLDDRSRSFLGDRSSRPSEPTSPSLEEDLLATRTEGTRWEPEAVKSSRSDSVVSFTALPTPRRHPSDHELPVEEGAPEKEKEGARRKLRRRLSFGGKPSVDPVHPLPVERKTSGPANLIRRVKSFGTSPILGGSSSFFSGSNMSGTRLDASTSVASSGEHPLTAPLSPPLPSPSLLSQPHAQSQPLMDESGPNTAVAPLVASENASRPTPRPKRQSTFTSFFRRSIVTPPDLPPVPPPFPPLPHGMPTAYPTPKPSFDDPSTHPISNQSTLPSLPSLQLSSPYRMSWIFPSSPSKSPPRTGGIASPPPSPSPTPTRRNTSSMPFTDSPLPTPEVDASGSLVGLGFGTEGGRTESPTGLNNSDHNQLLPPHDVLARQSLETTRSSSNWDRKESLPTLDSSSSVHVRPSLGKQIPLSSSGGSMLGAVTGFFTSSGSSSMIRSSSAASSAGSTSARTPALQTSEFGSLFDSNGGKGSGQAQGRKRGSSIGAGSLFSSSIVGRKRAGSGSSGLGNGSWIPEPPLSMIDLTSSSATGTGKTRSRASTDPPSRKSFQESSAYVPGNLTSTNSNSSIYSPTRNSSSAQLQVSTSMDSPGRERAISAPNGSGRAGSRAPTPRKRIEVPVEDGEAPETYVERLMKGAGGVAKSEVAGVLAASSSPFHVSALNSYLELFDFHSSPLDIALRKLLMSASLPPETQQIDRVMEAFAGRYNTCNPGLFDSSDTPYVLAFSLVMLSTDQFNKSNRVKMSKADYVRNTRIEGVADEILEYFFDQITLAPFIFVEEESTESTESAELPTSPKVDHAVQPSNNSSFFSSISSKNNVGSNTKAKLGPYHYISQGNIQELRVDLEPIIPSKSPFSFTGTTPFFDASALHLAFSRAPIMQLAPKSPKPPPTPSLPPQPHDETPPLPTDGNASFAAPGPKKKSSAPPTSLKISKIGVLSRKEDLAEGGKKAQSRKWRSWSVVLTASQLLLVKDTAWADSIKQSIAAASVLDMKDEADGVLTFPSMAPFAPDAVLSLTDVAAVYDSTYSKYPFVFRVIAPAGRQYLFQSSSEKDLNSWLSHINYAASFRTANIRMRGISSPGRQSLQTPSTPQSPFSVRPLLRGSLETVDSNSTRDDTLPLSLSPVSEEESATASVDLSRSLREAVLHGGQVPSDGEGGGKFEGMGKLPLARAENLRHKIHDLEDKIRIEKSSLDVLLRFARNLAVLTPCSRSTRDRIVAAAMGIEKRVRHSRMNLTKLVCHREVLSRDLLVEERDREQRSRNISLRYHHDPSETPAPGHTSRLDSTLTGGGSQLQLSVSHLPDHFASDYERETRGSLTDDELDRLSSRSAPKMQRSETSPIQGTRRLRTISNATVMSEDEFPGDTLSGSVGQGPFLRVPPSPSPSTNSFHRPRKLSASQSHISVVEDEDILTSEEPETASVVDGPEERAVSEGGREDEDWTSTRRVSLISIDPEGVTGLLRARSERRSASGCTVMPTAEVEEI